LGTPDGRSIVLPASASNASACPDDGYTAEGSGDDRSTVSVAKPESEPGPGKIGIVPVRIIAVRVVGGVIVIGIIAVRGNNRRSVGGKRRSIDSRRLGTLAGSNTYVYRFANGSLPETLSAL
jgi:hypothetical protein